MKYDFATIWLYGSSARGDSDTKSDLDVLVICDSSITTEDIVRTARVGPQRLAVSEYKWSEIMGMASYGSLFLHHIRLEGRCLFDGAGVTGRLETVLDSLGPYTRALLDVKSFRLSLNDVRSSLDGGGSIAFELSVLGTVVRHAAILGCYISGYPSFGRTEPVRTLVDLWRLDAHIPSLFVKLYNSRLFLDQRVEEPKDISLKVAYDWCEKLDLILQQLEAKVYEYVKHLPTTGISREGIGAYP